MRCCCGCCCCWGSHNSTIIVVRCLRCSAAVAYRALRIRHLKVTNTRARARDHRTCIHTHTHKKRAAVRTPSDVGFVCVCVCVGDGDGDILGVHGVYFVVFHIMSVSVRACVCLMEWQRGHACHTIRTHLVHRRSPRARFMRGRTSVFVQSVCKNQTHAHHRPKRHSLWAARKYEHSNTHSHMENTHTLRGESTAPSSARAERFRFEVLLCLNLSGN